MNDNQVINTDVLQLISNPTENAPTITRFVEEYFSELVPDSDYFTHLVRDDVGGEMLPPLPEEMGEWASRVVFGDKGDHSYKCRKRNADYCKEFKRTRSE